jgi:pimeloyl-ACP methyl ester carboxylesterase
MLRGEGPSPTDPAALAQITVPVLVVHGSETSTWFSLGARHVAGHIAGSRLHQIAGAAHFGPVIQPEAVAQQVLRFFPPLLRAEEDGWAAVGAENGGR